MKSKTLYGIIALFLFFAFISEGWSDDERYPIMRPDRDTLHRWIESYENAPRAFIDEKLMKKMPFAEPVNLLSHLQYTPNERQQGICGNCWAWAGTGVMEIALDVQEYIKDRLSIQYVNSCFEVEFGLDGMYACCGGSLDDFATIYTDAGQVIPWSNTNASYQDASKSCPIDYSNASDVSCEDISITPSYPITSITAMTVATQGISQDTAIANIKNVLNQNKGVFFGFFLPNNSDWANFYDFWNNDSESDVFNYNYSCGNTWVDFEGGGHAVLIAGYNDDDPGNRYWIALNSWGTASGGRPNGFFRIDMDIDYDCYFYCPPGGLYPEGNYSSLLFQTLDVEFAGGATTTTTTIDPNATTTTTTAETTTTTTIPLEEMSDLEPCGLSGWSYPIIPSSKQGTNTYNPATDVLKPSPSMTYVDFALCNEGNGDAEGSFTTLYIDDVEIFTQEVAVEGKSSRAWLDEQFSLAEGEHTLKLVVDVNDDIEEADESNNTFEMSFIWGDKKWPALYREMLGIDYQADVHSLRNFRDKVLIPQKRSRAYVGMLYKNSAQIVELLLKDKDLKVETAETIEQLLPEITCLLEGEEAGISPRTVAAIERLLDKYEVKAGPAVKLTIRKLKEEIKEGEIFNQLGIKVE